MSNRNFLEALGRCPIIAAVHSIEDAHTAAYAPCRVVFVLGGRLFDAAEIVSLLRRAGKLVFVHLDLADGVSKDASGVQILAEIVRPDGILTTKNNLIRVIRDHGMLAGLRCFILDGQSYHKAVQVCTNVSPDFVEVMPGILPESLVQTFCRDTGTPVVASGLVRTMMDANRAFSAGAKGISTSDPMLWSLPGVPGGDTRKEG